MNIIYWCNACGGKFSLSYEPCPRCGSMDTEVSN